MSENVNEGLRSVAKKVVAYQFFSIIILILFTVVGSEFDLNILVFLGFFIVAICGIYILKILIFDENICPNCNKSFLKKKVVYLILGLVFILKIVRIVGISFKNNLRFLKI
ncbi:hypothetical protein ACFSX8_06405 [Acinetobacter gyllenbergii]|uniref:hypothetical protein n=1 Tax=Acinetobacter gyllenbergii TaxID=134534 RepID=UPI00363CF5C1